MKRILNITFAAIAGLLMTSCNLDFFPSDELSSSALLSDKDGAKYIMDGCYAMLKDEVEHLGYSSGNTYVRHYFQMAEYPSDNICLSGRTTDPLYEATVYSTTDGLKNVGTLWWLAYKVIFSSNSVIEGFKEGEGAASDQLIGEAYFLRAMMHFHLVTLYAKPYVLGTENQGIVLRLSTNTAETTRATVGACYDAIVADLIKAAELMTAPRGNAGYANHDAALGLLSRVYLYMGKYDEVIDVVTNQMGISSASAASAKLDPDYANYFRNALTSKETLFCLAHTALETRGTSSIGSMYLNDGMGWGEVYASDPLLNLYDRYPADVRMSYILPQYAASGKDVVNFPVVSAADNFRSNLTFEVKSDASGWYFTESGKTYRVEEVDVMGNGEYKEYKVNYGGEDCPARLSKAMVSRNTFPNYFVSKFSYQDGDPMLSSPVFVRWAEVILNLAEAYAQKGDAANAYEYVNVIRTRAGIPAEGMFAASQTHGYTSALDVVLDERRMELAFEGHRMFDQIRVERDINREYAGVQPWEIVKYQDNKIQYPIPFEETSVSGIPQNPGY